MEQSWPVDKYDVPRGDLEFWAQKRGSLQIAATEHAPSTPPASALVFTLKSAVLIGLLSFAAGFSMQALV